MLCLPEVSIVKLIFVVFQRLSHRVVNLFMACPISTDVLSALNRLAREGAYTIVNETVDISDGGVSGVAMGGVVEFRPDSTPRGVESPGFAAVPLEWADKIFDIVYGASAELYAAREGRLEFSVHPRPRGWKKSNVLYWEYSSENNTSRTAEVSWPNDFSRLIGDKAYGLLIAHLAGVPVPLTTVVGRRIAPFVFGSDTDSGEYWIRTCPKEQVPGRFSTERGWADPFKLMQREDPDGILLASVLAQRGVPAIWSGAAIELEGGRLITEGVAGFGTDFMLGREDPKPLPREVLEALNDLHHRLRLKLGSVRFEWVFDGIKAWVVQLHRGASSSSSGVIVPGHADHWILFKVEDGLEKLRSLVSQLPPSTGIWLDRQIGLTSHLADVIRKAGIPAVVRERN
jgi:hypothetical protein